MRESMLEDEQAEMVVGMKVRNIDMREILRMGMMSAIIRCVSLSSWDASIRIASLSP